MPDPAVTYTTANATGTLHYTPVPNASGSVVITVQVSDGGLDNDLGTLGDNGVTTRTFTVEVTSVNDPPTIDVIPDPTAIDEDAAQQTINLTGISTGGGETQPLQITATSDTVGLVPHPIVTYASPAASGTLSYTPVAGESGTAIVTVTVTDGGLDDDLGTPGDNLTATDTFIVTVNDVDDPPTIDAIPDPAAIDEDVGLQSVPLSGISPGVGETATLVVTAVSGNPGLIPNPTVTYTSPNATGSLSYTPVANTSGSAVITVTVSDGGATNTQRTFTVNVNGVNDAPTFTPGGNQIITEDAPAQSVPSFLGTVSAGPNEAGQVVTVAITNVTTPGLFSTGPAISPAGVLTYTPAPEQFGTSTVTYTVSDNGGTANGGVDSSGPQTFTITINAVNDPPTLNAISDPAAILEDAAQQTINLAGIGTGSAAESAQPLQITAVSGTTAVIPNPTVTYVSPNATGSLDYTPVANAFGSAVITVTVTDGGLDNNLGTTGDNGTLVRTFTVNVTAVNDAPSFTKGGDQTVDEDAVAQSVNPWATAISAGPGESGQTVSFEITNTTNASLFGSGPSVSSAGVLTYTPAANQNGSATITLRITDDGGTANGGVNVSATQSFVITVNAVNDPPTVTNKNYNAQANMAIVGLSGLLTGVTDADTGVNGCTPTFSVTNVSATNPVGGNITNLNATAGTFDFNPPPGATGNVTFTYTVTDTGCPGSATSAAATVTVNVAGPAIWFVDDSAAAGGDGRLTSPFNTLAGAAAVDAAGHVIFLYSGTYTTGIALNATESLMGQGAIAASFDALMGINPPVGTVARPSIGGTRPSISVTSGTAVTLASGNVIHGLNVANTNGSGITGAGVGTLALANFDVTVTGGSALSLTTSGTVTATGTDNDLTSTNGTALNVNAVAIGGTGLTFKSISAGSASGSAGNGISLDNTGTAAGNGGLTVTGSGSASTGGTIQHKTGANGSTTQGIGIYLNQTKNASFSFMQLNHFDNFAIRGNELNGLTLSNIVVSGTNGNDAGSDEGSVLLEDSGGTIAITNSNISGGFEDNLRVDYNNAAAGPAAVFNVTGSTFRDLQAAGQNAQVNLRSQTSASASWNVDFNFTSSTFENDANTTPGGGTENWSDGILVTFEGPFAHAFSVQSSTFHHLFQGMDIASNFSADVDYVILNNNITFTEGVAAIAIGNGSSSTNASFLTGLIQGNVIGTSGVAQSGSRLGQGIVVDVRGEETAQFTIHANTIRRIDVGGIDVLANTGDGDLSIQITNNVIDQVEDDVGAGVSDGMRVLTATGSLHDICLDARNNDSFKLGGSDELQLRQSGADVVFAIEGLTGSGTSTANIESYLDGQNPLFNPADGGTRVRTVASVVQFTSVASCITPSTQ